MKPLTEKQLWAIGSLAALSPLLRLIPEANLRAADAAGWLSPLAASPALLLYAALLRSLLSRRSGDETLCALLRRKIGRAATAACGLWFLVYAAFLLRAGAERFYSALGVFTRWEPFALALLAAAVPAAAGGKKALGRAAQIYLAAVTGILLLVVLCAAPQMQWGRLRALRLGDAPRILRGALPTANIGAAVLFLLAFLAPPGKTAPRRAAVWTLRLTGTAALLSALAVGIFGAALTTHLSHPFFVLLRNIRLSRAMERMEALISAVWVLPDLMMLSSLLLLGRETLSRPEKPLPVWLPGALVGALSALFSRTAFGLRIWSETILPAANAVIVLAVPALALLRGRKFD